MIRKTVMVSLVFAAGLTTGEVGALHAGDCNENGIDDALDLEPRYVFEGHQEIEASGGLHRTVQTADVEGDGDIDIVATNKDLGVFV